MPGGNLDVINLNYIVLKLIDNHVNQNQLQSTILR